MWVIILILACLFLILNVIILLSLQQRESVPQLNIQNKISIIIAAKNEAHNIPSLAASIKGLNYCTNNFEVILVDDESSDDTFQTAIELTKELGNFRIIKVHDKTLPAKKGALTFGISHAENFLILITDADCLIPKEWLKIYSSKFDEGYDFIFGPAPFTEGDSFANKAARFENLRSSILVFAAAKLNIPYSAAARNFGFRKSAFDAIKGFSNTTETLSGDDDLLLREAVKHKMKIGTILNEDAFVFSSTKKSLGEYLTQRARHTKTSLYYLKRHQFILGFWHLLNILMLCSVILVPVNSLFLIPVIIKLAFDVLIVWIEQKKLGCKFKPLEIIPLQIFYEILLIINFAGANFRKDSWK